MSGQVFCLEKQNRPKLTHYSGQEKDNGTEDISHFGHGEGDGKDARSYHCFDDGHHCEKEIYIVPKILALASLAELAKMLFYPCSSPLS